MRINIGSKNQIKIDAVREIIQDYQHLKNAEIISADVLSEVNDQPKSLDETVQGAINRASKAFYNCDFSFGIESGLMAVAKAQTGYMDVCVCAIFDGKEYHLGLSSAWEVPGVILSYMIKDGLNMNDAAYRAGFTDNPVIGSADGLIGIVSRGRLLRKDYTKEAIRTALFHIDKK